MRGVSLKGKYREQKWEGFWEETNLGWDWMRSRTQPGERAKRGERAGQSQAEQGEEQQRAPLGWEGAGRRPARRARSPAVYHRLAALGSVSKFSLFSLSLQNHNDCVVVSFLSNPKSFPSRGRFCSDSLGFSHHLICLFSQGPMDSVYSYYQLFLWSWVFKLLLFP